MSVITKFIPFVMDIHNSFYTYKRLLTVGVTSWNGYNCSISVVSILVIHSISWKMSYNDIRNLSDASINQIRMRFLKFEMLKVTVTNSLVLIEYLKGINVASNIIRCYVRNIASSHQYPINILILNLYECTCTFTRYFSKGMTG